MTDQRNEEIRDELLLIDAQQGDGDALVTLIDRWETPLFRYACRVLQIRDLALDAVQETWLAVIGAVARKRDVARFRPWLFRILHHKCSDQLRKLSRDKNVLDNLPGSGETKTDGDSRIFEALSRLGPDAREVILLKYLQEFSIADIAAVVDVPEGTVKSRLHHARQHLRELMEG